MLNQFFMNVTHGTPAYSQANTGAITLDKPSGLAVGDMMIAHVMGYKNINWTSGMPSGWTLQKQNAGDNNAPYPAEMVATKVADSGDVAASNFTFTANVTDTYVKIGCIIRVTGQKVSSPFSTFTGTANSKTAPTLTPADANSIVFIFACNGGGEAIGNTFAIATDNPASWTQEYNQSGGGGARLTMGYAVRPQTTATGNGSWTSTSGENSTIMVALYPVPSTNWTQECTATVSLTASCLKGASRILTQTVTLTASCLKTAGRVLSQTVSLTASILRTMSRTLSQTVTLTASLIRTMARTVSETLNLTDTLIAMKVIFEQFEETVTVLDAALGRILNRLFTETVTLTATLIKMANRIFTETISLTDTLLALRIRFSTLTENVNLTATLLKLEQRILTQTITLTDTFAGVRAKTLSEIVTLTATMTRVIGAVRSEIVTITASIPRLISRTLTQTITLTATCLKLGNRILTQTVTLTASIIRVGNHVLTETVSLFDQVIVRLNGIVTNLWSKVARSNDTWDKQDRT